MGVLVGVCLHPTSSIQHWDTVRVFSGTENGNGLSANGVRAKYPGGDEIFYPQQRCDLYTVGKSSIYIL